VIHSVYPHPRSKRRLFGVLRRVFGILRLVEESAGLCWSAIEKNRSISPRWHDSFGHVMGVIDVYDDLDKGYNLYRKIYHYAERAKKAKFVPYILPV
jgi:hypothetical protein